MEARAASPPKLVPFVCPACAAENHIGLVALARAGHTVCTGCNRRLTSAEVARAMHAPRAVGVREKPGFLITGQRRFGDTRPR